MLDKLRIPLRFRLVFWVLAAYTVVHATSVLLIVLYAGQSVRASTLKSLEAALTSQAAAASEPNAERIFALMQQPELARAGMISTLSLDEAGNLGLTTGPLSEQAIAELRAAWQQLPSDEADPVKTIVTPGALAASRADESGVNPAFVIATSRSAERSTRSKIVWSSLIAFPFGAGAIMLASWYLSGIALQPLRDVADVAAGLRPESLSEGVDLDRRSPELDEVREELEGAVHRLDEGYAQQARFLANVSHELKTPIAVLRTEAEVLLRTDASEDALKRYVVSSQEEMDRLGKMVEGFLLLTRVREAEGNVQLGLVDLNEVVMASFEASLPMAELHEVSISPTLWDGEPDATIRGNADLLATAIGNIVRNAVRFSPKQAAVTVRAELCRSPSDPNAIADARITIRDRGPGIPDELVPRLFEPFSQSSKERHRGRGTGLGLQIAKGIVELHNGAITFTNLEQGCEFQVNLPVHNPG